MLARIFTEPEVRTILRRYDPKEKWQLDTEKSYMDTAIFCEPGADLKTDRYLKIMYVAPDYLLAERWEGSHYCSVDAVYKRTEHGYKKVHRRKHRKRQIYGERLFPVDRSLSENVEATIEDISTDKQVLPKQ